MPREAADKSERELQQNLEETSDRREKVKGSLSAMTSTKKISLGI